MADWVEEALATYMRRVSAAPGRNGLTRNQNKVLRAHPETAGIMYRTIVHLIQWELLIDLGGLVRFKRMELYKLLCEIENDWAVEVPTVEYRGHPYEPIARFLQSGEIEPPHDWGPTVVFQRRPRFGFAVFDGAMTIAKKIGLTSGHGHIYIHPDLLKKLRNLRRKQRIPEPTPGPSSSDLESAH